MERTIQSPKILVVDGDQDQRSLICDVLSHHYPGSRSRIVGVGSGGQCLSRDIEGFDIVLQEYNLPDIDGLELLRKIQHRADLPVIFVTAENNTDAAVRAFAAGAQDYVVKLGDYLFTLPILVDKNIRQHQVRREKDRLAVELQDTLRELQSKNGQLRESLEVVQRLAITDHLTGLANRRRFSEILHREFEEATRYGFDLTCCMCDLDGYKQFNDALGHQAGDRLLVIASDVIRSSLRSTDIAARYGGDEFVLLLPHTSVHRGLAVGDRIRRQLILASRDIQTTGPTVTMSIGVSSLKTDKPASADTLLRMADRALYRAKHRGRDRIVALSYEKKPISVRA